MARATRLLLAFGVVVTGLTAQGNPLVQVRGVGCGVGSPTLAMSPPILRSTVQFQVTSSTPGAAIVILGFPQALPWTLPGGCNGWLQRGALVGAGLLPLGQPHGLLDLPADPAWIGVTLGAQAAIHPTAAPGGFDVTNALHFTIGDRQGVLAGLPSPAGPHLAQVAAMSTGAWLDLGVPQPDPVHGLATGREYTPRMAWSASLQGAFLTGESGHGYVNPNNGRYIDDVWFYDFASHAWRCVKPGSPVATLNLQLDANQFEVDGQGELVPTAQLGHGYEFVCFAEWSQKFFMQPIPNTYWVSSMPQRLGWLPGGNANFPASQYRAPWLFDTVQGRWQRQPASQPAPDFRVAARAMAAQAIRGRIWVFDTLASNRQRIWWFDPRTHRWSAEATSNPAPAIAGNGVTCYDGVHERVYYYGVESSSQQAGLWFYDVASRSWHDTQATGVPPHSSIYVTGGRGLLYDAGDDAVLLWRRVGSSVPEIHPFDVASGMFRPPVSPPTSMASIFRWRHLNGFSDPVRDVHLFHVAAGDSGTGRIVAFRY